MTYEEAFKTAAEQAYHSGPPPSVGWWPTRVRFCGLPGRMRWWNGVGWSWSCDNRTADRAALDEAAAARSAYPNSEIEWAHPWW